MNEGGEEEEVKGMKREGGSERVEEGEGWEGRKTLT